MTHSAAAAEPGSVSRSLRRFLLRRLWNLWPPYLGAGIHIARVAPDFTVFEVELRMRPWNRNIVGTHFGGSLYAMTDPFFMAILMENLGKDYVVWDKAATIRFRRPGRGCVRARFEIPAATIAVLKARADAEPKVEPSFTCQVIDAAGTVVAEVEKLLYIRRKDRRPPDASRGAS